MVNNEVKDLEKIFLEIVTEKNLEFHADKEDNLKRANAGISEYTMHANYLREEDPSIHFSSDRTYQYLAIIHNKSNHNATFHLENGLLDINYFYPSGIETPHEDLINLQKFSRVKNMHFFKLCRASLEKNKKEGNWNPQGISINKCRFNYNETKELIILFLNYIKTK